MDERESLPGYPHPQLQAGSMAEGGGCKDYRGRGAIRAKRAGPKQPICVRAACPVNLRLRKRVPGRIRDLVEALHSVTLYLVVPPSDISKTKPLIRLILNQIGLLRHFHWLLHNDIERAHEAENDGKEVDHQRRDVGCGAVLKAY